jgi:hypothetical protein
MFMLRNFANKSTRILREQCDEQTARLQKIVSILSLDHEIALILFPGSGEIVFTRGRICRPSQAHPKRKCSDACQSPSSLNSALRVFAKWEKSRKSLSLARRGYQQNKY